MKLSIVAPGIWGTVHLDLARSLVRLGHRVAVYTEAGRAASGWRFTRLAEAGVEFWVISDTRRAAPVWLFDRLGKPWLGRRFFTSLLAVRRFLKAQDDCDIALVEGDWIGLFVALASRGLPLRWVVGIHDTLYLRIPVNYPGRPHSRWREWAKRWVLDQASSVRANSFVTRDALVQGGCDPAKIFVLPLHRPAWMVIPEGDLEDYRRMAREEVRPRWSIPPGVPLAIVMCRLDTAKGLELAVDTVAEGPADCWLLICGGDRRIPGMGSYRAALEERATQLGIAERVVFAGAIDKLLVARHLAAADLHLAPSVIDTYNYSVLEATFVGTPSLMSDRVGAGPWVVEAGGGEIVATRSPQTWGGRLAAWLAQPPDRQARRAAADTLGANTHPDRIASQLLAVLQAR